VNPEPLRIEPTFSPRIWGSRSLAPLFPGKSNLVEPLGEAWLTGIDSKVVSGPLHGKSLGEAWREMPAEWRGTRFADCGDFPLLLKFIFPTDKLSIQVHPDDAYASVHEKAAGGRGKTEMWYVFSAESSAKVLVGLQEEVNKRSFLDGLKKQRLEPLFQAHPVHAGDTLFIPAGTPHTMGAGVIVFEVQEYSDLTYRLYDYGRVDRQGKPRELHIDKAMDVITFGKSSAQKTARLPLPSEGFDRSLLAACRYFATERWEMDGPVTLKTDPSHFDLLVNLSGDGTLSVPGSRFPCAIGECWFLPANLGEYYFAPKDLAALMRVYVPDLASLRAELHQEGQSERTMRYAVFD
jgi:mannose-6-phosphate isomerase